MSDIYKFLEENGIEYERFDHPAVFTCEEADLLNIEMPGVSTKNLFLRDKNGKRHFLVTVDKDKQVDLGKLKEILEVSKLSFASEERLQKHLGLTPGSVTLLGVMNDSDCAVEVIVDEEIWGKALQCHPLINTASLVLEVEGLKSFLEKTKHIPRIIKIPQKTDSD
ncbi:MAG: prolyl-tRNA synthetase associated domain-containing protein [Candidatus Peregrinibacteria bacterium]|nr:prolyl-tRNA synthetase associated domain-containing protein [Candidatus Peregrinibacteria bacterium]